MIDLGTLGGCCSFVSNLRVININNHGQIVGGSLTSSRA